MADDDVPARPRRERPLRAPGREAPVEPPEPPTVTTPPSGPPVIEFAMAEQDPQRDDHVELAFDGPTMQRRWTIALRIFLVIPHLLWLFVLSIAAVVVIIVAWFAALFTARVPEGMASFVSKFVQYQARLMAYGNFFLTDTYPPFALDADYAVTVRTNPGRLNRAAVFFRFILMVPGNIVATFASTGAFVASPVIWLIALVLGRLPTPVWEANAGVLSYMTRYYAFSGLLTAEQPNGLFGDKSGEAPAANEVPDLPDKPRVTRLVQSKAARRIVVLFLVLGVLFQVGSGVAGVIAGAKSSEAYRKLDDSHDELGVAVGRFGAETQRCNFGGGLECLHAADTNLANAFERFASDVEGISFPATVDVSSVIDDARDCADALRRMAAANDQGSYGAAFGDYSAALQRFDDDYSDVAFEARFND